MKTFLKYIFFVLLITTLNQEVFAKQKTKKQHPHSSAIKKIKAKNQKKKKQVSAKESKKTAGTKKGKKTIQQLNDLPTINEPVSIADPVPEKTITIISAFKPQLKNVSKINFGNAVQNVDTSTIHLFYQVPSQNLTFQYKPISLIPRAIKLTQAIPTKTTENIKLGYGNYFHHLIDFSAIATDQSNNVHSVSIINESIQGLHHLQSSKELSIQYNGNYIIDSLNQIQTSVNYQNLNRYRYGMVPDSSVLPLSNFAQNSTNIGFRIGWLNFNTDPHLITLRPTLEVNHFTGVSNASNTTIEFTNPMYFTIKGKTHINFDVDYANSNYNNAEGNQSTSSIFQLAPSVELPIWKTDLLIGVNQLFTKDAYALHPNLSFRKKLSDTNYILNAGWNTKMTLNSYAHLASINPWIMAPTALKNQTKDSKFIELLINANKHLDYSVGFEFNDYTNLAFFNPAILPINKTINGLMYATLFEDKATTIEFSAKLRYQFTDKIILSNKFNYIQFNSIQYNAKPWGIVPIHFESNLNWFIADKWAVDANAQFWTGATFSKSTTTSYQPNAGFVLNAGFNYKVSPKWNVWAKGSNLLDTPYERWGEYPSLGLQLMGGIVYSFRQ
jgi:hypothetical protein